MELEICATSLTSVQNAARAGAHRVELCSGYAIGGLTPSWGLLQTSVALKSIAVHCLIRPREGNFCYTTEEVLTMKEDILAARKAGVAGVVIGALTPDGALDLPALNTLIAAAAGIEVSFHRAFDGLRNPEQGIVTLAEMGIKRILSTGKAATAFEGLAQLKEWENSTPKGIAMQAGGGINASNCKAFQQAGLKHLHCSAFEANPVVHNPDASDPFDNQIAGHSSFEKIEAIVKALRE